MNAREPDEMDEIADGVVRIVKSLAEVAPDLIQPIGDLVRAMYGAQTDSLIDMRGRLLENEWPQELADQVILVTLTRATSFTDAVAKAINDRPKK